MSDAMEKAWRYHQDEAGRRAMRAGPTYPSDMEMFYAGWHACREEAAKMADGWDRPTGAEDVPLDIARALRERL